MMMTMSSTLSPAEQTVLNALKTFHQADHGALIFIGDLKDLLAPTMLPATVNSVLWALAEKGLVCLHRHDLPARMTACEVRGALNCDGNWYIGVAIRHAATM